MSMYGSPYSANPDQTQNLISGWDQAAQRAYYASLMQGDSDKLAFAKAQAAFSNAMNIAGSYGYAPGGDWFTFGQGGATIPPPGTPTLQGQTTLQGLQNQLLQNAIAQSGVTGMYAAPLPSQYTAGTVLTVPGSQTATGGAAYGIVNPD